MLITSFLYDTLLLLGALLYLPINAWQILWQKKAKRWIFSRFKAPSMLEKKKEVIWLHAVSLGETKALLTLLPWIKKDNPDALLLVTVMTVTAWQEAQKNNHLFDNLSYLPLDLSWIMRRMVARLNLKLLILVEGDFWLHMVYYAKKKGARIALANGCISETSSKMYSLLPFMKKHLFSQIDVYALQAEHYIKGFKALNIALNKIKVTGNIKLSSAQVRKKNTPAKIPFKAETKLITIGCSHPGEETSICKALLPLIEQDPLLVLAFAPRHLDRAIQVQKELSSLVGTCDNLASMHEGMHAGSQIVVIDQMGLLNTWYARSILAIVAGSFVPGVGGHNLFEPILSGAIPLFGPFVERQLGLRDLIVNGRAGLCLPMNKLLDGVSTLLEDLSYRNQLKAAGKVLREESAKNAFKTWDYISSYCPV
ncbi:hypothetical protein COB21_03735 [Candidatus Aerophobetes bacterium]|uniref:3-deoxy-D-manno-octulosonic acid transferase n=1 Tax=Aerophobetes bacterium TaxID=2030807 RepID=A0A2A4X2W5_UNCAE|nr:MAG: hypothetical protein COB21_03735 [Candidatus Aerophobetes bacterium]